MCTLSQWLPQAIEISRALPGTEVLNTHGSTFPGKPPVYANFYKTEQTIAYCDTVGEHRSFAGLRTIQGFVGRSLALMAVSPVRSSVLSIIGLPIGRCPWPIGMYWSCTFVAPAVSCARKSSFLSSCSGGWSGQPWRRRAGASQSSMALDGRWCCIMLHAPVTATLRTAQVSRTGGK
eukprot:COSAG02_NODE_24456_length_687_cov_1.539116_1_plen_177_part_00